MVISKYLTEKKRQIKKLFQLHIYYREEIVFFLMLLGLYNMRNII